MGQQTTAYGAQTTSSTSYGTPATTPIIQQTTTYGSSPTTIVQQQPAVVLSLAGFDGRVYLRSCHGRYLSCDRKCRITADRTEPGDWETWTVIPGGSKVAFKSYHGRYLCDDNQTLIADRNDIGDWEKFTFFQDAPGLISLRGGCSNNFVSAYDAIDYFKVLVDRNDVGRHQQWTVIPATRQTHPTGFPLNIQINLMGIHINKYLCAESNGVAIANRSSANEWETFYVHPVGHRIALESAHEMYLAADLNGEVKFNRDTVRDLEMFEPIPLGQDIWAFKTVHGTYFYPEEDEDGKVYSDSQEMGEWERWILKIVKP